MAVVVRTDLDLPPGKMAAQVGHAVLSAWRATWKDNPDLAESYADSRQTKLILAAPDEATLWRVKLHAQRLGVAAAAIVDAGRTVLPEPTLTALGLGPMGRTSYNALTRGLELL